MTADSRYRKWLGERLGDRCINNLKKNGFDAHWTESGDDARRLVMELVAAYQSFGFGGVFHDPGTGAAAGPQENGKGCL